MSEKIQSNDPVVTALELEKNIADALQQEGDKARASVRTKMEEWMALMDNKKVRDAYADELGGIEPEVAEAEMLTSIKGKFPVIAKSLGWTPQMEVQQTDMAA